MQATGASKNRDCPAKNGPLFPIRIIFGTYGMYTYGFFDEFFRRRQIFLTNFFNEFFR